MKKFVTYIGTEKNYNLYRDGGVICFFCLSVVPFLMELHRSC